MNGVNRTRTYDLQNIVAIRTNTPPYARHTHHQSDLRHDWRLSNVATARSAPNSRGERTFKKYDVLGPRGVSIGFSSFMIVGSRSSPNNPIHLEFGCIIQHYLEFRCAFC